MRAANGQEGEATRFSLKCRNNSNISRNKRHPSARKHQFLVDHLKLNNHIFQPINILQNPLARNRTHPFRQGQPMAVALDMP
jgi:hypothetical protein